MALSVFEVLPSYLTYFIFQTRFSIHTNRCYVALGSSHVRFKTASWFHCGDIPSFNSVLGDISDLAHMLRIYSRPISSISVWLGLSQTPTVFCMLLLELCVSRLTSTLPQGLLRGGRQTEAVAGGYGPCPMSPVRSLPVWGSGVFPVTSGLNLRKTS